MEFTKSQRYIHALQQLPQFVLHQPNSTDLAVHALTGVIVSAYVSPEDGDCNLIKLRFAAGHGIDVIGSRYLTLQLSEAAAHEFHSNADGSGQIATRAAELYEYLMRKHDL